MNNENKNEFDEGKKALEAKKMNTEYYFFFFSQKII